MASRRYPFAVLVLATALPAHAEVNAAQGVRLSFVRAENASECISARSLEQEIARRMGRDPFIGPARQWIEGIVTQNRGYYEVQLFERDALGKTLGVRRLREVADDCRKLDDAVELAIALIIDPTARLAKARDVRSDETAAPLVAPVPGVSAANSTAATARNDAANATVPRAPRDDTPQSPPPAAPCKPCPGCTTKSASDAVDKSRSPNANATSDTPPLARDATNQQESTARAPTTFVAADALVVSGVLPSLAPGVDLSTRIGLGRANRFALRLGSLYLPEQAHADDNGRFSFGLTSFEAGVCFNAWTRRVGYFGCGSLGLGSIHAVVHDPEPFQPGDRLWIAGRLEVGLNLRIAGPVWLEARLFDLIAANRWRFRMQTDSQPKQVFLQSPFMPGAALGLGLHFH